MAEIGMCFFFALLYVYPIAGQTACPACPGASHLFLRERNLCLRVSALLVRILYSVLKEA
jgi:hypothetical protein